ncbi:Rieske (2Fe-2S) protein [Xanthomonas sp. MUS 060]|uniref:Rieske (2Fe-2S) protein n=1 Tax=Xanthomonas sp. MUS 060 TaxID=1588031 RepID=UPI0005F29E0D|nr:Rieske (2Fe-2S) protein [Xanthomonas sp. MUS 060]
MSDSPAVLASLHHLVPGELIEVQTMLGGESESLLLYRDGDDVRAWLNVCPHAGRRLDWAPGQFLKSRQGHLVCAAHGAAFDLQAGQCVSGPCRGESLHAVPVTVRAGQVVLL